MREDLPLLQGMLERKGRTSHAHVVDEIGRDIVAGLYPVGSILPGDNELAERFGVSRTVLREAMKTLAAKGLIAPRARIGTRVTEQKRWNMFDRDIIGWYFDTGAREDFLLQLYEVRMGFEPHAAELAAEKARPEDIARLRASVRQMADLEQGSETLAAADLVFHMAVVEASRNPFLTALGSLIEAALSGMFRISAPTTPAGIVRIAEMHREIVDAIENHQPDRAKAAMTAVILDGRQRITER